MSTFTVPVVLINDIEPIPGADAIEIAVVGEFRSVVRKGMYSKGDLVVYIPEFAVVPPPVLEFIGLWDEEKGKGMLAGSEGNRVRAVKLRGMLSQGLIYPLKTFDSYSGTLCVPGYTGRSYFNVTVGQDVAELMGIFKYEPPIPFNMSGEMCSIFGNTVSYDIENMQKYPNVITENDDVVLTEKIHGTLCQIGIIPNFGNEDLFHSGDVFVASKGLGSKGLVFKNVTRNITNVYVQTLDGLYSQISRLREFAYRLNKPIYVFGEVFGSGVQDLTYGQTGQSFRAFDCYVGKPGEGRWLNFYEKRTLFMDFDITMVPVFYIGPYSRIMVSLFRDGNTVAGEGKHIREGVVVTPTMERYCNEIGRVILKDVSPDYLIRKGVTTEYN